MAQAQHVRVLLRRVLRPGGHVREAPRVKPAAPELHAHLRGDAVVGEHLELLHRTGAEVAGLEHALALAAQEHVVLRAVAGDQRHIHPAGKHPVADGREVLLVVAEGAVLVLHLHHQHRAAVRHLKRDKARNQLVVVVHDVPEVRLVVAAQADAVFLEQPRREAAELPLRADVRRRTQNHVQADLLRQAHEALHVRHAVKAELTLLRLVEVPGDVGFHRVAAHGLELHEAVAPVLRHHAEIVNRTGNHLKGLSIQIEIVFSDFKN